MRERMQDLSVRQYAVVTLTDGEVHIAGFSGDSIAAWSGIRSAADMAVSVQGNRLVGEAVVTGCSCRISIGSSRCGRYALSDRLMRALEAGSAAGGDIRCNRDGLRSSAVTAFILIARGGDPPYAARDIGVTDQGTGAAPWLAISEATSTRWREPHSSCQASIRELESESLAPNQGCRNVALWPLRAGSGQNRRLF